MKKIITFFVCFIGFSLFAQSNKIILEGKILLHDGTEIPVKDMYFVEDKVYFVDLTDMKNSLLYDVSYQKIYQKQGDEYVLIKEGENLVNEEIAKFEILNLQQVENPETAVISGQKTSKNTPKLDIVSARKIYLNGNLLSTKEVGVYLENYGLADRYQGAVKTIDIGDALLGGGLGFAIGWVAGALIFQDKDATNDEIKNRAAVNRVVIIGSGTVALVGAILRISSAYRAKNTVNEYNSKTGISGDNKPQFNLIANGNGIGIGLRW
ncbi:MAG: hypothetical protein LBT29_07560 [Flavobacteriaceae bacterium]|jgi:hypothetical protein|nr:hypothetical protein [Flavobacteriaceae bacterium]